VIALNFIRSNELSSSNTRVCVIDEFHVTTESDEQIRRDIIWRDIARSISSRTKQAVSMSTDVSASPSNANNLSRSNAIKTMGGRCSG
jgi:hypothetical protein